MNDDLPLTDDQRFPLIDAEGRARLEELRQHPHAPRYNLRCGDRLTAAGRDEVAAFERELFNGTTRPWLDEFVERCVRTVPFYRRRAIRDFASMPAVTRDDLRREPWAFVPDDQPLDDMVNYWTSGASGHSMDVLSHPVVASKRLPILRKVLARYGVTLDGGARRTSILFVCSQSSTFTYASLSAYLDGAAHVKINLNPAEWRADEDRVGFIDHLQPEIVTGDPLSLLDLAGLPVSIRPKAMISSAMLLLPRIRERLEQRFDCPVADIYSTCETGPIAVSGERGFELFLSDVLVEILRPDGSVAARGERGEIAFTGGRNPFLPLLRYRTGDWAALSDDGSALVDFDGRQPVVFRGTDGRSINNIDITIAFRAFPLTSFTVHQNADDSLLVRTAGMEYSREALAGALRRIFGADQTLTIEDLPDDGRKRVPFSRDPTAPRPSPVP